MRGLGSLFLNTRSALDLKKTVSVVVQFYPWFKFSFLFFSFLFFWGGRGGVWECKIMSLKEKKVKFKPSIKLNHNICAMIRSSLTK